MSTRQLMSVDLVRALNGTPRYLGRITSTTVKDNSTTAAPFSIPYGSMVMLYPSAAVNVGTGSAAGTAVTNITGVPLAAAEKFYMLLKHDENKVQVVGTADTDVWALE